MLYDVITSLSRQLQNYRTGRHSSQHRISHDISGFDRPGALFDDSHVAGAVAIEPEQHPFKVENNVGDIFGHAGDSTELVQHSLDAN